MDAVEIVPETAVSGSVVVAPATGFTTLTESKTSTDDDTEPEMDDELRREFEEVERQIQLRRQELERIERERAKERRRLELQRQLEDRRAMLDRLTREIETPIAPVTQSTARAAPAIATAPTVAPVMAVPRTPATPHETVLDSIIRTLDAGFTRDISRREFDEAASWMYEISGITFSFDDMNEEARKNLVDRYRASTGRRVETAISDLLRPGGRLGAVGSAGSIGAVGTAGAAGGAVGAVGGAASSGADGAPPAHSPHHDPSLDPVGAPPLNVAFKQGYAYTADQILHRGFRGSLGLPSADIPIHYSKLTGNMARATTDYRR